MTERGGDSFCHSKTTRPCLYEGENFLACDRTLFSYSTLFWLEKRREGKKNPNNIRMLKSHFVAKQIRVAQQQRLSRLCFSLATVTSGVANSYAPPSPQITLSQTLTCNFVAFGRPEERAYLTSRLCKPLLGPDPGYWARLEVPEYLIGSAGEITKMRPNEKSFGRKKKKISASFWLWSFSPRHSTNPGSPNGW